MASRGSKPGGIRKLLILWMFCGRGRPDRPLEIRRSPVFGMPGAEILQDRERRLLLPERRERSRQIAIGRREVRVERRRLAEERDRSLELSPPLVDHAQPLVASGEVGAQPDHRLELRLRLVVTLLAAESGREEISKLSIPRLGLHRGPGRTASI